MIYLILFGIILVVANLLSFQDADSEKSAFLLGITMCNLLFLIASYFINRHKIKNKG